MRYALILHGKVHEIFSPDGAIGDQTPQEYVGIAADFDVREIPNQAKEGWIANEDGTFSAPSDALTPEQVQSKARALLAASDVTAIRCTVDDGLPLPDSWRDYRAALRVIASSGEEPEDGWPAQPPYPEA